MIEALSSRNTNEFIESCRNALIDLVTTKHITQLHFPYPLTPYHFSNLNLLQILLTPSSLVSTLFLFFKNKLLLTTDTIQLLSLNALLTANGYTKLIEISSQNDQRVTLALDVENLNSQNISNYSNFQESLTNFRYLKLHNPVFPYNFKVGNYLPDNTKQLSPQLMVSAADITMGVRKSS